MQADRRLLVLACDEAYAMPLATTLRSIVDADTSGGVLEFHVLTTGMAARTRARVLGSLPAGRASIEWHKVELDAFLDCATRPHISKMTYARLLLPIMFPGISKLLYLDADILVLRDLGPLWTTELKGAVVGAVVDGMDAEMKAGQPGLEGVARVQHYFNAGVLLIDLDRWRRERVSERALDYLMRHPDTPFSDQDALNAACDGRWLPLDPQWNCQAHLDRHCLADMPPHRRPGIIHFVTAGKPWNRWVPNANAEAYDAARSRTMFARTLPERALDLALQLGCLVKEACKRGPAGQMVYRTVKRAWQLRA